MQQKIKQYGSNSGIMKFKLIMFLIVDKTINVETGLETLFKNGVLYHYYIKYSERDYTTLKRNLQLINIEQF